MRQILDLIEDVLTNGRDKDHIDGPPTKSVFGRQIRFNLEEGFPLQTTNELQFAAIVNAVLRSVNLPNSIWRHWRAPNNVVIDQLERVEELLRTSPDSRRLIASNWDPANAVQMATPLSQVLFHFYITESRLSLQVYQRSAEVFSWLPSNVAHYAVLLTMLAHICNLKLGDVLVDLGDTHLYVDHLKLAKVQLAREPLPLPRLTILREVPKIEDFRAEDFLLEGYKAHPPIRPKVSA